MKKKLVLMCIGIACATLLCSPGTGHAKRGLPDSVIETSCGDNNTGGPKVLIAFATNYGSTYTVAEKVAEVLCGHGYMVDLRFAKNVTPAELLDYDAVIVGSCIYIEEWHEDALQFLENNQDTLSGIPVALYCVNGLLGMNFDTKEELVEEHYLQPMYTRFPKIHPVDVTAFAGVVNYRILKFKDWWLLHLMFMPRGNWTDFDAVESWAQEISDKFH